MKQFIVIAGILALLAVGQAQDTNDDDTTDVPDENEEEPIPEPPPSPPVDQYYPFVPPRRFGPQGPIRSPFGNRFDNQQQFGQFGRRQGPARPGNPLFFEYQQRLGSGSGRPQFPGNSQSQGPFGFGQQQSGPFGGRQRQQQQGQPRSFGNRFGPPQSNDFNQYDGFDGSFQGPGFGGGNRFGPPQSNDFNQFGGQQFGSFGGRQRPQQQGQPGNFGNRFGPPQSNDDNQYDGFGGSFQGPGIGGDYRFSQQQQQQPFRRFPQREPVLLDIGSGNTFGDGNSYGVQRQPPSTTAGYDYEYGN